jgi:cell division topological specificity factor
MGLLDFFKSRPKGTASAAKDRLMVLVQHERLDRNGPDFLPLLRKDILEAIKKYVRVDADAVSVNLHKDGDQELLELSVTLPDRKS